MFQDLKRFFVVALWISLGLTAISTARAQVPALIHYQGRVLSGGSAFEGSGHFKFAIVNADASQTYWLNSSDGNGDGEPDNFVAVPVTRGLYSVLLGDDSIPNMAPLPGSLFSNPAVYLRVWFSDGNGAFERLSPDQRIAAVGYALMAASVPDASITSAKLTGTLLPAQIPALDASKITTGTFSVTQIPALDAAKITTGTFTAAQVPTLDASKITSGTFSSAQIPALDAAKIESGIFSTTQIPALDASKITSGTFSPTQIPALDAAKIASGTLDAARLPATVASTSQIAALQTQIDALSVQLGQLAGSVLVSSSAADPTFLGLGYVNFSSVAAPDWRDGATDNQPSARFGHTAVWTGSQFFVWGGQIAPNTYSSLGGVYQPDVDQWQPSSSGGAPEGRIGHTMTWNGGAAFVWGGFSENGFLNTGGRYDPATLSWTSLPLTDAPVARDSHVAGLIAPFLVVWGGRNSSGLRNDGALYNPTTGLWTALSLTNPPEARMGATATAASDRILIWGGTGNSGALNTGAQLIFQLTPSVAPLQWQAISAANAPSARTAHTAVMAGAKMIVWGGRNGGAFLGDGGIYDPVADTWQAIPTTDAPAPRFGHTAVWTGSEMLILGGQTAAGDTATGGAFNPATGHWRTLMNAGAIARESATSAWTGTELLTFGGKADNVPLAALQRVNPQPTWSFYRKP